MGLRIQRSNRVEALQQILCHELANKPLSDPLASEIVVVPTFAMSRWLNLRFAQQLGIAANIDYPSPSSWLWQIATRVIQGIPEQDPLAVESMLWKIFSLLPGLLDTPEVSTLRRYLIDDADDIKRWQLSAGIAEVFDRYQQYRPELIRDWSAGRSSDWQAIIWRQLTGTADAIHRIEILDQLIDRLASEKFQCELPERITLFATSSLPPLTLEVILAVSRHCEVTFYQHSPSEHYFADLKSTASLGRMRLNSPDQSHYYQTGNELLASWGRQAQTMQTLLLEIDHPLIHEDEHNHPAGDATLLNSIQQNIFDLGATPLNTRADDSITVHICHSAMRECQVLHDRILKMLSDNPQLNPEDILVMVPEISRYAPYIEAVFGYDESADKPQLPWNLSDINLLDDHPLIRSFLQLLRLPASRFEISEVLSLLEVGEIRRKFDLDEATINDIQHWLEASRVRWGIDADFKQAIGQAGIIENTWEQARNRLFAGYALGEVPLWNDIAPLPQFGTSAALHISHFLDLFERLDHWRKRLQQTTDAVSWIGILSQLVDDFYIAQDTGESHLQEIRETIDALNSAANSKLSAPLLRHWMEKQLASQQRRGRLFSGGITFCGLRPMRNLPFEVICLLGMNDQAFPRRRATSDFDIIAQTRRLGDPDSAAEDRFLMLETLLCARQKLYISYSGRSLKDNSELQPSVLVSELIDYIDSQCDADERLSDKLTHLHPMQPFSADNYISPLFSYDSRWCGVARKVHQLKPEIDACGWPHPVDAADIEYPESIDLKQLHRFLAHPVRYYFNNRLKLFFDNEEEFENDELFSLDSLSGWQARTRLLDNILEGQSDIFRRLRAEGLLPHGPAGRVEFQKTLQKHDDWLYQVAAYSELSPASLPVQLKLQEYAELFGEVQNYYPGRGITQFSASKLNGPMLLRLWVDHLCLCAGKQIDSNDRSILIASDQTLTFTPCEPQQALEYLADYCRLYIQGQSQLLPVFPKSSYAFALQDDPEKGLKEANKAWQTSYFNPAKADEEDSYLQLALRGSSLHPIYDAEFADYAVRLYQSALKQMAAL